MQPQKRKPAEPAALDAWQKTPYANLIRYVPSGKYFARIRVRGKLILQSLKTKAISVANLRLADLEKAERLLAENATMVAGGKMTVGDALKTYRTRLHGDRSLKPRTKAYREECISKLLRTWPKIEATDVRLVNKTACLDWAARLGKEANPSVSITRSAPRVFCPQIQSGHGLETQSVVAVNPRGSWRRAGQRARNQRGKIPPACVAGSFRHSPAHT